MVPLPPERFIIAWQRSSSPTHCSCLLRRMGYPGVTPEVVKLCLAALTVFGVVGLKPNRSPPLPTPDVPDNAFLSY